MEKRILMNKMKAVFIECVCVCVDEQKEAGTFLMWVITH